uniref:Heterogeneous nuclear ribonucleoprotein H3 n=1 Tax=Salmo trutta TaxID=8032 RepID=A0A674EP62_SALTR
IQAYYEIPRRLMRQRPSPYDRPMMGGALLDHMRGGGCYAGGMYDLADDNYNGFSNYLFLKFLLKYMNSFISVIAAIGGHGYAGAGDTSSHSGHFVREEPAFPFHIDVGPNGKATDQANVEFWSHEDAVSARSKDKNHMRTWISKSLNYCPLFLNSTASGASKMGRGGGFYGSSRGSGLRGMF